MSLLSSLIFYLLSPQIAQAKVSYECLRELVPVTNHASIRSQRKNVEAPFFINNGNFMVFPEIAGSRVTGFFVYNSQSAWYYDSVEKPGGQIVSIKDLAAGSEGVYELVTQPAGLETISIQLLPGFSDFKGNKDGPVMLGASVLPVVGAFVSRPDMQAATYTDPRSSKDKDIKDWIAGKRGGRSPASVSDGKVSRTLVRLKTQKPKETKVLWEPLLAEYRLRREWVQKNNLDEQSFRQLTRIMKTSCND